MFVLVFTAILLLTLGAIGTVTDRRGVSGDPPLARRPGAAPATVPLEPAPPTARPRLVLLDSADPPPLTMLEAARRDHPAGRARSWHARAERTPLRALQGGGSTVRRSA